MLAQFVQNTTWIFAVCLVVCTDVLADDTSWPNWRGSKFDHISTEKGWQTDWPQPGAPTTWRTNVGTGYSSVSTTRQHVFTMGHSDEKEVVSCLAVEDGRIIWKHEYDGNLVDNLHRGGPGSTPTIDGPLLYSIGREGQLHCLRRNDGHVVWSCDLQQVLGVELPEWGFTCSPLVRGSRLMLEAGCVAALDKTTGRLIWKTPLVPAGYGSPTPLNVMGTNCLAVLNNEGLLVVSEDDGDEIDFFSWETNFATNSTSPVLVGDKLFISTGYSRGCALLEWQNDGLHAVYETKEMCNHMNNSVLWNDHLFGFDGNAHFGRAVQLVCMEAATGKVKWTELGLGCGALMIANGKLVILSEEGELVIADTSPQEYHEISRMQAVPPRCWTVPLLSDGRVYCRNDVGDLSCIDLRPQP